MSHAKHNNGFIVKSVAYLLLIVVAMMMTVFYWMSDVVDQQQEAITSWVSETLGYPIEIAQIKLTWIGASPQLALNKVKVMGHGDSAELLSLETLYLDLNVLSSFWFTDLRLDDITVVGLNIAVVRDRNGQIVLKGFNQRSDSTPLFADLIVRANSLDSFHLKTVTVDYIDQQQTVLTGRYQIDQAVISHRATDWQTRGQIFLPASLGDNIQFSANWDLNQQQPELTTWRWTIDAKAVLLAPLHSYLHWQNIAVEQGRLDTTVHGRGVGNILNTANIELELSQALLATNHDAPDLAPVVVDRFNGQFAWQLKPESWVLSGTKLQLTMNGKTWPDTTLLVSQQDKQITAKSDFLRIEDVISVAALSGTLPELLLQQHPAGDIEQSEVQYYLDAGLTSASFQLKNGQLKPWADYPGINNIDAAIQFSEQKAKVQITSQQVTLQPATWLEDTLFFDNISGEIAFEKNAQAWRLQGNAVTINNADLNIQFDGQVERDSQGKIFNDTVVTLDNIAVARWQSYFPEKLLSEDFKKWSKGAFLAGEVVHGQITLQGDLAAFPYQSPEDKPQGKFDLSLDVKDVQLHYARDWPDLFNVTGTITGQGNNLIINSQQGTIAGFTFEQVETRIDKLLEAKPILTLEGLLNGSTQQALNFLQNSPLKERFGTVVKTVVAKGRSDISLSMTVPLADTDDTQVKGDVSFINSQLYQKTIPELPLTQVNGLLAFHNQGVTANNITGQFLDQRVDISVFPKGEGTVVAAKGNTTVATLRQTWPGQIPDFITGETPYQLEVAISERGIGDFYVDVSMTSNLLGLAIALPEPLQKAAGQDKAFKASFKQAVNSPSLVIHYDGAVETTFMASKGDQLFDAPKLAINMTTLDAEKWLLWSDQHQTADASTLPEITQLSLNIGELTGYGQHWSEVNIRSEKLTQGWRASIQSQDVKGQVIIPRVFNQQAMLQADLERLALTIPSQTDRQQQTGRSRLWPSMKIDVADLVLSDTPLGHFQLTAVQAEQQWTITSANLTSDAYTGSVTKGVWQQSAVSEQTELALRVDSGDFANLLEKFGYQPTIEAKKAKLLMSFSWPGEPLAVSEQSASGTLSFKLENGKLKDIEPGAAGRVFGLLSIAAIPRRLTLDFNELFGKGLNFSTIRGAFDIANGLANTQDFILKSESANIEITGPIDLINQRYNQKVKVTPNVSSTLPIAGAVAGGPVGLGLGTAILLADKLAGKLFDKQIVNMISYNYNLTGPWQAPDLSVMVPTLPAR